MEEGDLSKLLGSPFGLNLDVSDIDNFFYSTIARKLAYWSTMKFSLAGRAFICNHIFLIRNYLWSGKELQSRTRVSWRECCLKKKYGGLGLVDPEAAKTSLLCK